jgi:DNA-binding NarL/FixJ family response regulator
MSDAGEITVVPADDHAVVRKGLRLLLEADGHGLVDA